MSLKDKVDTLRLQLGLSPETPMVDVVDQAVSQLGLESKGMTIMQKAEACCSQLGGSPMQQPAVFAAEVPSVAVMQPVQSTWAQPMAVPMGVVVGASAAPPMSQQMERYGGPASEKRM